MSYDITLRDPVTNEVCEVPAHLLTGGTYLAEYNEQTNTFSPKPNTEAWLNITYNYSKYFYEAMKAVTGNENGIRDFDEREVIECLPVIEDMIKYIKDTYSEAVDGDETTRKWKTRVDEKTIYYDENGNKLSDSEHFKYLVTDHKDPEKLRSEIVSEVVSEGDTNDYWAVTAANAVSALIKLKALMHLRPDAIISVG